MQNDSLVCIVQRASYLLAISNRSLCRFRWTTVPCSSDSSWPASCPPSVVLCTALKCGVLSRCTQPPVLCDNMPHKCPISALILNPQKANVQALSDFTTRRIWNLDGTFVCGKENKTQLQPALLGNGWGRFLTNSFLLCLLKMKSTMCKAINSCRHPVQE